MRETDVNLFMTFAAEPGVTTQAEASAWESDCLHAMQNAAAKILSRYPGAHEEIEDAVNEALRATLKLAKQGKKIEKPKEYLTVAAARRALNTTKRLNKKEPSVFIDGDEGFELASNILAHDKQWEIKQMCLHCMNGLSEKQSVIAALLPEMSPSEIAATLGMTVTAVNVTIHRIRQQLSPLKEYLSW